MDMPARPVFEGIWLPMVTPMRAGIWLPMVTPMRAGHVDCEAAQALAATIATPASPAWSLFGSTGEGNLLHLAAHGHAHARRTRGLRGRPGAGPHIATPASPAWSSPAPPAKATC